MRLCISSCAPPALPYKHWHFGAAENRTARWARRQQSWWCDVSRTPSPLTIADVRDPELANPSSSTAEAEHSARKQVIVTAERTRAWDGRRYIDTYTPPPRGMRARWRGRERERYGDRWGWRATEWERGKNYCSQQSISEIYDDASQQQALACFRRARPSTGIPLTSVFSHPKQQTLPLEKKRLSNRTNGANCQTATRHQPLYTERDGERERERVSESARRARVASVYYIYIIHAEWFVPAGSRRSAGAVLLSRNI